MTLPEALKDLYKAVGGDVAALTSEATADLVEAIAQAIKAGKDESQTKQAKSKKKKEE